MQPSRRTRTLKHDLLNLIDYKSKSTQKEKEFSDTEKSKHFLFAVHGYTGQVQKI